MGHQGTRSFSQVWCSFLYPRAHCLGLALSKQCCASQWPQPQDTRGRQTQHHGHSLCPIQRGCSSAKSSLWVFGKQALYSSCITSSRYIKYCSAPNQYGSWKSPPSSYPPSPNCTVPKPIKHLNTNSSNSRHL